MEERGERRLSFVCLFVIIGLSSYLRLAGITWGHRKWLRHYLNFQPDEFISMRGMLPIQPLAGKIKAPGAYFEGTFNYYLWAAPEVLHAWTHVLSNLLCAL